MLINDEENRLKELHSYGILDTLPEDEFDNIVELASYICDTPISLISLVDEKRQWFKAKVGIQVSQTSREIAFCHHAIMQENLFEIEDAKNDDRFKNNPLVTSQPNIRFYAGRPLITKNGYALGTLCVIDTKPKKLSSNQKKALENLSKQVILNIEARKNFIELKNNEMSYMSIFDNTSDLIHIIDQEGRILKVNNSWKKTLNYSEEDIKKMNIFDIIYESDIEHCAKLFYCIKNQGDCPSKVIYSIKSKDGKKITVEASVIVERYDDGKLKLIKSILRDITDKVELENKLKISEKKFRDIYELSPVGIAVNDLKTGAFLEVNQAICNFTGYTKDEILKVSYWDLTPRSYEEDEKKQLESLNKIGRYGPYEKEYINKNGKKFPVLLNGVKFTDIENRELILSVIQDITEIKEYQKELEIAKQKALDASKSKSMFLANMSHEIRTPLNSIIGFSDLMMKTKLDNEQIQYMSNVYQSANFLLELINDILDFSKIESGKLELYYSNINILDFLREVLNIVKYQAHKKGIELLIDYPKDIFTEIYVDSLRLKQILTNLLNNAVKFTSVGEVKLKIEILEELEEDYKNLRFSVSDTGIGISKENLEKIFSPFEQADYSTSKNYGGTGLGLTISKKLLKLMNSDLNVNSKENVGTTFYFDIILKTSKKQKDNIFNVNDKILVLSSKTSNLNFLDYLFKDLNIKAEFSNDYNKYTNEHFDLIFIENNFEDINNILDKFNNLKTVIINNSCQDVITRENVIMTIVKPIFKHDIIYLFDKKENFNLNFKEHNDNKIETDDLNVLVVEDNKVNMLLIKTYFKNIFPNINLITSESGKIALESYKNNKIDLILTDIQMPEMNGYELAQEIRKINTNIPIIALTASSIVEEKEKSIQVGINDFITKPITQNAFREVIKKWIENLAKVT